MGLNVLCTMVDNIKAQSPAWYAIIGDEATDISNREQFNLSIRWINENYEIHENTLGLFLF